MSIALCLWMQSWRLGRQKITFSASVCQAYLKRQDHCSFLQVMVVVGQEVTWNENILSDCHYWKSFTGKCPSKASFGPWNKLVSNFINLYRAPPAATRTQGTWGWKLSFTCDTEQWAEGWMEDQMLKAENYEVGFGLEKSGLDFKRWYHSVWLGKHATLNKNRKTSLRKHTLFKYLEHFCWQPVNTNKLVQQCFQIFNRFFYAIVVQRNWGTEEDVEHNYPHRGKNMVFPTNLHACIREELLDMSPQPMESLSFSTRIVEGLLHGQVFLAPIFKSN